MCKSCMLIDLSQENLKLGNESQIVFKKLFFVVLHWCKFGLCVYLLQWDDNRDEVVGNAINWALSGKK